jgi:hypothetical protein
MKKGDKINLVRHTDDNVIEITKTITKVNDNYITFKGSSKVFKVYYLKGKKGEFCNFINHNTTYSTEPYVKPKTFFQEQMER